MIIFETEVLDIIPRTPGVKSFRFKIEEDADFEAGQFFFVSIKIDNAERTKHFSFSNSPTEKGYIEFTKRLTGSEFSKGLDRLRPGDWAKIKMPYGSFTLPLHARAGFTLEAEDKRLAFLSGGIGITPIRSMCKFATDTGLAADMVLLYGNNTEADIIFKDDFDNMQAVNKNIRIVYTLTSTDAGKGKWKDKTGYIDADMIKEVIPDYTQRIFYVCGPPAMVASLTDILRNKLTLSDEKIRTENFTGYK